MRAARLIVAGYCCHYAGISSLHTVVNSIKDALALQLLHIQAIVMILLELAFDLERANRCYVTTLGNYSANLVSSFVDYCLVLREQGLRL